MAENAAGTENATPKITGIGQAVRAEFPINVAAAANGNEDGSNSSAKPNESSANSGNNQQSTSQSPTEVELNEDQLKAYFEKNGMVYEGIDKLKEKLTKAPASTEVLTDEQKATLEKQKEDRILNEHLSRKGTPEQFVAFKSIVAADKKELGLQKEIEDLISLGFDKERAAELASDRYFQYKQEDIDATEDPIRKEEMIKQREAGTKKLERKGAYLQNTAKSYLDTLSKDLQEQDEQKTKMEQHTSKVEDAIKKFVRKETIEIGQVNDQKFDPVDFDISDTALNSAKELLSDAAKFEENLFNKEGDLNIEFILPHLVRSFSMQEAAKKSFLEGADRQVKFFDSKFSPVPPKLGGSGNNGNATGKIAGVGKPQYGTRPLKS